MTRLAPVLVVFALAGAATDGPAAVPARLACGPLAVTTGGPAHRQRVQFTRGSVVLATVTFEPESNITGVQCRANVAGRDPAILISNYTGGMHCCYTLSLYTTTPFRRVLAFNNNSLGWTLHPVPGGAEALVLNDGHFDYYDDLTHVWAPSVIPLAACFRGGRFVDCTREFPDVTRGCEARYTADLRHAREVATPEDGDRPARGGALGVYLCQLLGGHASVDAIEGLVADETGDRGLASRVRTWLRGADADVRPWTASRAGLLRATGVQEGP